MTKRYLGNIITQNPTAPAGDFADSAAKGVWSLEEQLAYQKAGLWPVPGKFLNVEDVFSTYLYDGTNVAQTITNGIDLAGEGGLVWQKLRTHPTPPDGQDHYLRDTERGVGKRLRSNSTAAEFEDGGITSVNSDGFTLSSGTAGNQNGATYASWTFRKAPKFFDVVTWTGNSTSGREIAHNLGSVPGMIIVKSLTEARQWMVYHRSTGNANALIVNSTAASASTALWNSTDPTSTVFTLNDDGDVNTTGNTYVAYLFAHNDGDGGFNGGDIIKCGSFTTDGSGVANVDLGFEPAWLLTKASSTTSYWALMDEMRGFGADVGMDYMVQPNTSNAEVGPNYLYKKNATGFSTASLSANQTYIYIAIRRGTKVPESATEVFAVSDRKNEIPSFPSGFPVDFLIGPRNLSGDNNEVKTRLISSGYLRTNTNGAETSASQVANFAHNDGFFNFDGANANQYSWMWKRAPGYFDVVAYTGDDVNPRTITHNLGAVPEMLIFKCRNVDVDWEGAFPRCFR